MSESESPFDPMRFMFSDLAKAMSSAQSDPAEVRRQFIELAISSDPQAQSVPLDARMAIEELYPLALRYARNIPFLEPIVPAIDPPLELLSVREFATRLMDRLSTYLDILITAISSQIIPVADAEQSPGDLTQLFVNLSSQIGPMLGNAQIGSLIGHFALAALSGNDLVLPAPGDSIAVIPAAVGSYAEKVGQNLEEVALYWLIREALLSFVIHTPVMMDRLDTQVRLHLLDMKADGAALVERFTKTAMTDPSALANLDPQAFLSIEPSEAELANRSELEVTLAVAYTVRDLAMSQIRLGVFGSSPWIDALETMLAKEPAHQVLAGTFGFDVLQAMARSDQFASDVKNHDGALEKLVAALFDSEKFPKPDELAEPGLWLMRLQLES